MAEFDTRFYEMNLVSISVYSDHTLWLVTRILKQMDNEGRDAPEEKALLRKIYGEYTTETGPEGISAFVFRCGNGTVRLEIIRGRRTYRFVTRLIPDDTTSGTRSFVRRLFRGESQ